MSPLDNDRPNDWRFSMKELGYETSFGKSPLTNAVTILNCLVTRSGRLHHADAVHVIATLERENDIHTSGRNHRYADNNDGKKKFTHGRPPQRQSKSGSMLT
jgi:hypothetical protein